MATTTCPGCGAAINLEEIPGKPRRLQGRCGCNGGRPVIEMNAPKATPVIEKKTKKEIKKDEQAESIVDGDNGADGSGGAVYQVP
jgi:hypothetical protein